MLLFIYPYFISNYNIPFLYSHYYILFDLPLFVIFILLLIIKLYYVYSLCLLLYYSSNNTLLIFTITLPYYLLILDITLYYIIILCFIHLNWYHAIFNVVKLHPIHFIFILLFYFHITSHNSNKNLTSSYVSINLLHCNYLHCHYLQ
jgi:hypothetical protein